MAEPSIYDISTDDVKEIISLTRAYLKESFKGVKPYRQEPITQREALVIYDELTPDKKQWLLQQFGQESVLPYFSDMEKLKARYTGGQ